MTRREALRKMGAFAAGAALSGNGWATVSKPNPKEMKKKRILAINGSTRKSGNTADMLNIVLGELAKEGHSIELIELAGETIHPCKACFACAGKGNCVFHDDRFCDIYELMTTADAIILGSPTYSADVSATLKAVIERASVVSDTNPGMFRHKVGAGIAVARRAGGMNVLDTLNHFFLNKEMLLVGSSYWNVVYGRLPGEAAQDEEGTKTMIDLGKNVAWILDKLP